MPQAGSLTIFSQQKALQRAHMGAIFAVVGLLWLLIDAANTGRLNGRSISYGGMLVAAALVASVALRVRARRLAIEPTTPADAARMRRIVVAVNILEWVAVATAVSVLMLLHLPQYIPTAAGIIVGLYLYPIAGALRAPLHTVTATLLVGWNVAALALLPRAQQPALGAAGTATILFASSAITLAWALWRTRFVPDAMIAPATLAQEARRG